MKSLQMLKQGFWLTDNSQIEQINLRVSDRHKKGGTRYIVTATFSLGLKNIIVKPNWIEIGYFHFLIREKQFSILQILEISILPILI